MTSTRARAFRRRLGVEDALQSDRQSDQDDERGGDGRGTSCPFPQVRDRDMHTTLRLAPTIPSAVANTGTRSGLSWLKATDPNTTTTKPSNNAPSMSVDVAAQAPTAVIARQINPMAHRCHVITRPASSPVAWLPTAHLGRATGREPAPVMETASAPTGTTGGTATRSPCPARPVVPLPVAGGPSALPSTAIRWHTQARCENGHDDGFEHEQAADATPSNTHHLRSARSRRRSATMKPHVECTTNTERKAAMHTDMPVRVLIPLRSPRVAPRRLRTNPRALGRTRRR